MENETLKQRVIAASYNLFHRLDGYGMTETGWEFHVRRYMEDGYMYCYEKQGVTVEFHDQMPADWYCWKVAANILKLTSNP